MLKKSYPSEYRQTVEEYIVSTLLKGVRLVYAGYNSLPKR